MDNTLLLGLELSIKISAVLALVVAIGSSISAFLTSEGGSLIEKVSMSIFALIISPIFFGLIFFCILHPLINLFHQDYLSPDFYIQDASKGILQLRISTYLLAYNTFFSQKLSKNSLDFSSLLPDDKKIISKFSTINYGSIFLRTQNIIYLFVISLLWVFTLMSTEIAEVRLASWALFFIIDDWSIIKNNIISFNGVILRSHKSRIINFNILLSILLIIASYKEFNNWILTFIIGFIFIGANLTQMSKLMEEKRNVSK